MERPDWVVCVKHNHGTLKGTWCGQPALGFLFTGIEHAAYNGLNGGRLVICPACYDKIQAALSNGLEEARQEVT